MINDKLIPVNLEQEMKRSFISYAMAVIVDRPCRMCGTV